ncbi:MAG TPA: glutathione S-transferase family protein [Mesorhizobium sp.]|jgi:glutathione S-transferase|uniref:glutathione S-transferase family protein n=1 Tax=Mesorhizobium sp. TaxID=1871066 RepID=UPI002DDDA2F6|nr:glutathione S-transferase family protein [Mesorhizobium sp.]HEV2504932.1 glutathione S-transferase family protein [Mesorhizobium sp.]
MQTLTLVSHHLCPYVQRAAIALAEKGVPFEKVLIDLADKPDWFLAVSPLGKVPLLIVRQADRPQAVLFESSVICEFIEETRAGPKLHPADPLLRAQHRAWMEYGSTILSDIWGLETTQDATIYDQKRAAIADKLERLEAVLGDGPYFAGRDFSLVDAVFAPVFRYFDLFDTIAETDVFAKTPRIRVWRKALAERPSVRQAVGADYPERLHAFLRRHDAYLLRAA